MLFFYIFSEIKFYPSTNIIEENCVIKEEIDSEDFNIDHDITTENTIANNLRSFKLKVWVSKCKL